MHKNIRYWCILAAILFAAGVGMLLYPCGNQAAWYIRSEKAVESFLKVIQPSHPAVNAISPDCIEQTAAESEAALPHQELLEAMQAYNRMIYETAQTGLCDPWSYQKLMIDPTVYGVADGVVGVLSIPKMELVQPIYLGATAEHLANGVAQLTQTSMPIGGSNSNCVLAGHRGWRGALLFRHIDVLEIGDTITITNLWDTLTYQVSEIRIIDPDDIDEILIQPGHDLVTLLTCHPYGSGGRYRYLVICQRMQ